MAQDGKKILSFELPIIGSHQKIRPTEIWAQLYPSLKNWSEIEKCIGYIWCKGMFMHWPEKTIAAWSKKRQDIIRMNDDNWEAFKRKSGFCESIGAFLGANISMKIRISITTENADTKVGHKNVSTAGPAIFNRIWHNKEHGWSYTVSASGGMFLVEFKSKHTRVACDAENKFFYHFLSLQHFGPTFFDFPKSNTISKKSQPDIKPISGWSVYRMKRRGFCRRKINTNRPNSSAVTIWITSTCEKKIPRPMRHIHQEDTIETHKN